MTSPILIVDDEPAIRRLVRAALEREGYHADEAANGAEALEYARRSGCELVLLDLGLPDRDGLELVPLLKAMDRAVIVLTARDRSDEKVTALDLGADDYVTKPFDTAELLARVRVARRHLAGRLSAQPQQLGPVTFEPERRRVTRLGVEVHLTPKEYALLAELARYPGRVMTHQHLLKAVWGAAHVGDVEYLRVTMRSLRAKLEEDPGHPRLLLNDPGIGYRLASD
jgi:two-component system, OmpR family, KDP operon response regulator KdpE